jgi:Fic family protein
LRVRRLSATISAEYAEINDVHLAAAALPAESDPLLHASLAHIWFVTIHPFYEGNGRIARAIADMALARAENSTHRYYSMSAQIRLERGDYARELESAQKATLDVTRWHAWFVGCLLRAVTGAQEKLGAVLAQARFCERFAREPLNERQILVLNRVLDGLEGKLATSKWAKLAKCSQDTANRDVLDLLERGVLEKNPAGGRSTSYSLAAI